MTTKNVNQPINHDLLSFPSLKLSLKKNGHFGQSIERREVWISSTFEIINRVVFKCTVCIKFLHIVFYSVAEGEEVYPNNDRYMMLDALYKPGFYIYGV